MRGELYFRVLGPVTAERAGTPIDLGGPQARGVLSLLLLNGGHVVSVDRLIDGLWGDRPPASARVQLQGMVSELRRALGEDGVRASAPIETRAPGYRLRLGPGELDLEEFRREVAAARDKDEEGDPAAAASLLTKALARWRGPAFADIVCPSVQGPAADLEEMRLGALEDRIEADLALGRHDELIVELRGLIQAHPLRERLRGLLMTVLAREGRLANALEVYRETRRQMVDELGLEPSPQLQQLHRAILTGLTGTPARSRYFVVPRQLPADVPGLVGRDEQLDRAFRLLAAESAQTPPGVAITGPGGIGKTALALRLAHRLRDRYVDGQLYARLGTLPTGEALAKFLRALGVPPGGVPTDLAERTDLMRELLYGRRVLMVLDDVTDEDQLRPLLPAEPRCGVLVTSRQRLAGADSLRSMPLDVLPDAAGTDLFRTLVGASRADAEPQEAAEVVRHCGGLPLAIRIAAARLASRSNWTIQDMARRLSSQRDRLNWLQHGDVGVRACLQETYAALTEEQQRLFRLLGLLPAPELPAWVPGALLDERNNRAEQILEELVDVHLVEPAERGLTGPRYRMHDLVHLFARELADHDAERRAGYGRVLDGWLDLAATADGELPHWFGLDPEPAPVWKAPAQVRLAVRAGPLAWFDEERSGLLAQVRHAAAERYPGATWALAQRLTTYLDLRGHFNEWVAVLRQGLRAAEQGGDRLGNACMLGLLVDAEASRLQFTSGFEYAGRALAAYRGITDPRVPEAPPGEYGDELAEHVQALERARHQQDAPGIGLAAFQLCTAARYAGHHGGYLALFEEAREAFAACGARISELWTLKNAGLAYLKQRRYDKAAACLGRGLTILIELGAFQPQPVTCDIAAVLAEQGRFDEAEALARETLEHAREHHHRWDEVGALHTLGALRQSRGDPHGAIDAYAAAICVDRRLHVPDRMATTMLTLAELCQTVGDHDSAEFYRTESASISTAPTT